MFDTSFRAIDDLVARMCTPLIGENAEMMKASARCDAGRSRTGGEAGSPA
jgi:hypothetical protein